MKSTIKISNRRNRKISERTIHDVVETIVRNFDPNQIVLFGSYASGSPTPDSDLDLMVVMQTNLPRHKRATAIRLLFHPAPCAMDIFVYTPAEIEYWKETPNHIITEAFSSGRVIYERSVAAVSQEMA